ncbi:hypothetical protein QP615_21110, partial [Providencia rettgeri]
MKTTHIVYRLNNVRVSQKSQLECASLKHRVDERNEFKAASAQQAQRTIVREHFEHCPTKKSWSIVTRCKKTPSGCEVKRLSVHGGCLGNQRRW